MLKSFNRFFIYLFILRSYLLKLKFITSFFFVTVIMFAHINQIMNIPLLSIFIIPPLPKYIQGVYWNHFACLQFCSCVRSCVLSISLTAQLLLFFLPNLVWWCIIMRQCVMQKKMVHCLNCQGHSKGIYNQNMTIFAIYSKLKVRFQPNLVW